MKKFALYFPLIMMFSLISCTAVSGTDVSETVRVIGRDISLESTDSEATKSLSPAEKNAYNKLKQAAAEMSGYVVFDDKLTRDQIVKIFNLVYTQENGIFWLDSIASPNEEENAIRISFRYSAEDVKYMQGELSAKVNEIINAVPEDAGDYGKIKFIHDYIVLNCDFTKDGENVNSAYGVLIDGKGQCEGYAFAFGLLASKMGLTAVTVTGTNEDGDTHAWNKVISDNEWYNVDCTWDDPVRDFENPDYLRHFYMLVPDKDIMGITHFENKSYYTSPPCTAIADNYFYYENLLFDNADKGIKTLTEQIDTAALTKSTECEIRFSGKIVYDEAMRKLYDNGGLKEIIEKVNADRASAIINVYTAKDDNLFIIHLSLVY
jgi:hypothetical protein